MLKKRSSWLYAIYNIMWSQKLTFNQSFNFFKTTNNNKHNMKKPYRSWPLELYYQNIKYELHYHQSEHLQETNPSISISGWSFEECSVRVVNRINVTEDNDLHRPIRPIPSPSVTVKCLIFVGCNFRYIHDFLVEREYNTPRNNVNSCFFI